MVIVTIIILSASSLLFSVVGLSRLFSPVNTYSKNSGIDLPKDVNLLSEVRGQAAVMLGSGIIFALGAIFSQVTLVSLAVATLLFIGFAVGRIIGMIADGKPNKQVIMGLGFELFLGAANVFGLVSALL